MAHPAAMPEVGVRLLMKSDDQPARDLRDLDRGELESLRAAVESTLAELSATESDKLGLARDAGFSCEWWPPD